MDLLAGLKADLEQKKKKSIVGSDCGEGKRKQYVSRGELERIREKEYREAQEREEREKEERRKAKLAQQRGPETPKNSSSVSTPADSSAVEDAEEKEGDVMDLSVKEVIKRLRARGEPITLFAETNKERKLRLRQLELAEERSEGQRNDFARTLEAMDSGLDLEVLKRKAGVHDEDRTAKKTKAEPASLLDNPIDIAYIRTDPTQLYQPVYAFFKRIMGEWEDALDERPEEVKRSVAGKRAAATQRQTAEYIKPLFKHLKRKDLETDILVRVAEIAHYMQQRLYLKAQDAYLRLSIGNAPWPIGVTMVGIHERSAREKIFSNQVAHVLNDETSRKWIQSIKRLMTFCQDKYPPDSLAQRVG